MKTLIYLFAPVAILFCSYVKPAQLKVSNSNKHHSKFDADTGGYKLVWADEFNTNGRLDTNNWVYEKGFVRNQEFQSYDDKNVWCENGHLIIEARRTHQPNPNYVAGSSDWKKNRQFIDYTSGCIKTEGKQSWQYGRFMMRAKINTHLGLWPAFWTLGEKGSWPSNGEIDIMEYYRQQLLANIAVGTPQAFKALWYSKIRMISSFNDPNWSDKFHIWRMDWDEHRISLYVDDILLNEVAMDSLNNRDGLGVNPFKQKHYLLLNLAIGGLNGGDPSTTDFPNRYEIDYVRVYQK